MEQLPSHPEASRNLLPDAKTSAVDPKDSEKFRLACRLRFSPRAMSNDAPDAPNSVDDALGRDHQRMDGLLRNLQEAILSNGSGAREALDRFARDLVHHMTWEEETLFPAVKSLAGAKERRSIESLEIDHERLRDTLRNLESSIAGEDFAAAQGLVRWLETLLQGHNCDEEHGVYVEADHLVNPAERRAMIERFVAGRPGV